MMKILIFSDSHGARAVLYTAMEQHHPDAVYFLGDGARDMAAVAGDYPDIPVFAVAGNCDICCDLPWTRLEKCGGVRVLLTHGHVQHVKQGLYTYSCTAAELKVSVALFGHTHCAFDDEVDGVRLFNPGSAANGEYGMLIVDEKGVTLQHFVV